MSLCGQCVNNKWSRDHHAGPILGANSVFTVLKRRLRSITIYVTPHTYVVLIIIVTTDFHFIQELERYKKQQEKKARDEARREGKLIANGK